MSLTRNLEKAKKSYKNKNVKPNIKAGNGDNGHNHYKVEGQYIKSLVYGGLDGIITTFAIVAGVSGAALSSGVVLILGFANLIADGISMAVGDYLSTKAENEYKKREREREEWEVENNPKGVKQQLVDLYQNKGITKKDANTIVSVVSKYKEAWLDIMMLEELNIVDDESSPIKNGMVTFFSFMFFGFIPISAYLFARFFPYWEGKTFLLASILTAVTLFILGSLKVKLTDKNWFVAGMEMLIVGGLAAGAAFGVGHLLAGLA